jgi:hypothetical protein
MSANVRIAKLNELLGRVASNAARPRVAAAPDTSASRDAVTEVMHSTPVGADELELDEPSVDDGNAPDSLDGDLSVSSSRASLVTSPENQAEADDLDLDATDDASDVDLDELDLDEPPESGSARVADPIGRAMAEEEHAAPLTPPPESGPEPAKAPSIPTHGGPTMEQLGQTIQLDEGPDAGELEVDEPIEEVAPEVPKSHLEMELPSSNVGTFDTHLSSPPEAQAELERVRLGQAAELSAHVVERPSISTNVVDFVGAHTARVPESFLGWLDSSLDL